MNWRRGLWFQSAKASGVIMPKRGYSYRCVKIAESDVHLKERDDGS
jgi:hypothetical protein